MLIAPLLVASSLAPVAREVVVTAPTPLSPQRGGGAGAHIIVPVASAEASGSAVLQSLEARASGVSLSDPSGNGYQQNLVYRGFQASPLQGAGQGLAVYVDGARFNQPFGDTVNWDLVPDEAVAAVTLDSANPLFGLNALGGSLSVGLKTGFSDPGGEAELAGGSFRRRSASLSWGAARDGRSLFVTANGEDEDGWRDFSPQRVRQLYADLGARRGGWESHAGVILADNHLTGQGPAPVELLAARRRSVFTHPDSTANHFGLLRLTTSGRITPALALQASAYLGRLQQRTANGDASDAEACADAPQTLCLEEDGPALTDLAGAPIPNFLAGDPYAQLNATSTRTTSAGLATHVSLDRSMFGRASNLTVGGALDAGWTSFSALSALGALTADRGFAGPGAIIDQAGGPIAPVSLRSRNTYAGLYVSDALKLTPQLTAQVSARLNLAWIRLSDLRGVALNGRHDFTQLNPAAALLWQPHEGLTAYLGYAQANRAPTPAELSCASPEAPCTLANFFVADPPLKQARAATWEAGLRGRTRPAGVSLTWSAGLFRTETRDDITFVLSDVRGRGYFQNVGRTRRQGVEGQLELERGPWRAYANGSWMQAEFRAALLVSSPDNPAADEAGAIEVRSGDRLPATPRGRVNLGVAYDPGPWRLGLAVRSASSQVFVGDEANLQPRLEGYTVANLDAGVRLGRSTELFAQVHNLANARYATFGTFTETAAVALAEAPGASDPRSLTPGEPRSIVVGVRAKF